LSKCLPPCLSFGVSLEKPELFDSLKAVNVSENRSKDSVNKTEPFTREKGALTQLLLQAREFSLQRFSFDSEGDGVGCTVKAGNIG